MARLHPTALRCADWLIVSSVVAAAATGCAVRKSQVPSSQVQDLGDTYGWFFYGSDVVNALPEGDARPQTFQGCGHERGRLKLFSTEEGGPQIPAVWWDDRVWRRYARPAAVNGCREGETHDAEARTCWKTYGLQFYPSSPIEQNNRMRVTGASPLIRAIPKDEYPAASDWCRFDGDTALVWVAGVSNRGLGLAWNLTDNVLLASILAWNRNVDMPQAVPGSDAAGHGKLRGAPAYLQIVQNDSTPYGGITGNHSEIAIRTMVANLELAYRSGIKTLEVVTHSNGIVTAQLAYSIFAHSFAPSRWNDGDWVGSEFSEAAVRELGARQESMKRDRLASGTREPLAVNFYHMQAAPSQRWGSSKLDRFGFYSDMLPTAKWVRKTMLGIGYWGWDWYTPDFFAVSASELKPTFRFYYNRADWMTYDYYRYSSVGRRETKPWRDEISERMRTGELPDVKHYHCPDPAVGVCGPGHEQNETLWYFASPAMPDTGAPVAWEAE